MCRFKSAIVLKNGDLIHHEFVDSHEDLITLNNLKDKGRGEFVRVELIPTERWDNLDKYEFTVDERETPDWFEQYRDKTIARLKRIVKKMIITEDVELIVNRRIILSGDVKVGTVRYCIIGKMYNSSKVGAMYNSSKVGKMYDSSKVGKMWDSSKVGAMCDSSEVGAMCDSSEVGAMCDSSKVGGMYNSSKVGAMYGSSKVGAMYGSSEVGKMCNSSKVGGMWGSSEVGVMYGSSEVEEMWNSSKILKDYSNGD